MDINRNIYVPHNKVDAHKTGKARILRVQDSVSVAGYIHVHMYI